MVKHKYLKELAGKRPLDERLDVADYPANKKTDKRYQATGVKYSDIWNFNDTILAYIYEHLRYYKDYTIVQLYPSYDKETGKKTNPNMVKYNGKDYYLGSLIDILLDKIRYYFNHDWDEFYRYKPTAIKGHKGEPDNALSISESELKHWQAKGLFKDDGQFTTLSNPHIYQVERTDQVGLFKYRQYTGDIWDIWKVLSPQISE